MFLNEVALKRVIRGIVTSQWGYLREEKKKWIRPNIDVDTIKISAEKTGVMLKGYPWWNDYVTKLCKNDEKYDYKMIHALYIYLTKFVHFKDDSHGIINLMSDMLRKKESLAGFSAESNRLLGVIEHMINSRVKDLKIPAVLHIVFCNLKGFTKVIVSTPNFYDDNREFDLKNKDVLARGCKNLGNKIADMREDKNTYHDFYQSLTRFKGTGEVEGGETSAETDALIQKMTDNIRSKVEEKEAANEKSAAETDALIQKMIDNIRSKVEREEEEKEAADKKSTANATKSIKRKKEFAVNNGYDVEFDK